ncbi:MAG: hypothetical protein SPI65_05225 [Peptoniphilus sp.]|nr:hypothetical protein [Peptoniphilus sp.]
MKRLIIFIILIAMPYLMQAMQPDWDPMAWENFSAVVANSWLFKLVALFVSGLLGYLLIHDMTRRERFYWGIGILILVACCHLLAILNNNWVLRYIGNSPHATTTITFLAALLLADGFERRPRKKNKI